MQKKNQQLIFNARLSIILIVHLCISTYAVAQYQLRIDYVDKDSTFQPQALKLRTNFSSQFQCREYVNKLPELLNLKGYASASIDNIRYDTNFAQMQLYLGVQQNWVQLRTDSVEKTALNASGFNSKNFSNKPFNINQLGNMKKGLLNYYENNGYPFAAVFLDSIFFKDTAMTATLIVKKGPLYHIDSISVKGKIKISNSFLQHYLGIPNGSIYNKEKLNQVSKRLLELPYLQEQQPSELLMLGTGSILNLYLLPKPSSQANFLVGFLPNNTQTGKLQITGDVNLDLKNALGNGETILLNWQQLQLKSPRLNIGYHQPYIFKSPVGLDFLFGIFKKDSGFIQLNTMLGIQYLLSANKSGNIFIQRQNNILLNSDLDTNQVIATKTLPPNIDVSSTNFGINYSFNNTNYKFNPISGNEVILYSSIGLRKIKENSVILGLSDSSFNYATLYDSIKLKAYQFRIKASAAHYFPIGKKSTVKAITNIGIFSTPDIFRNELFQIGGFQLLRGFNEESIYATQYAVATAEYRSLIGLNSYLFGFVDAGWVKTRYQSVNVSSNYISTGLGLLFETKLGLLNMSIAIGKQSDVNFNLSQATKIHFGYINYF